MYIAIAATYGGVFTLPYSTTKSALNGFFRSLNHELIYNGTDVSVTLSHLGLIGELFGFDTCVDGQQGKKLR